MSPSTGSSVPGDLIRSRAATVLVIGTGAAGTRGCHNRTDHPDLDPAMLVSFRTRLAGDQMPTWEEPVGAPPAELGPWLE